MQLPSSSGKKCSQCQSPAELDALLCESCGRVFPMQSAEAPMMAPPSITVAQARVSPARQLAFASVFLLVAAAGAFGVHAWYVSSQSHEDASQTAQGRQATSKTIVPGHALPAAAPNPQFFHAATHQE